MTNKVQCLYRCEMCGNTFLVTHELEGEFSFDDIVSEFSFEPHNPCVANAVPGIKVGVGKLVATENAF